MTALTWSPQQELLLRGAVGEGPEAERAAAAWLAQCSVQDLGPAEYRVLPLLAAHLPPGDEDPVAAQIHRVVRFTWLRTQLLVTRSAAALRTLTGAGIPVMLAKGAAVLAHTGWAIQLRPMDDLDVVVPRACAVDAATLLRAAGLRQPSLPGDPAGTGIYDELHGLGFEDPAGAIVDVHWHVLHGSLHHGADAEFWARAQPALLRDLPLQVLSREDTLLQAVAHGMELNVQHPLRWAADAVLLLRGAPAFDWEVVGAAARRHRIARAVAAALRALGEIAPDVMPAQLPASLRRAERRPALPARAEAAGAEAAEFVRRAVAPGERPRAGHALAYLKELWALDGAREIPRHAAWIATGRRPALTPPCAPVPPDAEPIWVPGEAGFAAGDRGTGMLGPGWWSPTRSACGRAGARRSCSSRSRSRSPGPCASTSSSSRSSPRRARGSPSTSWPTGAVPRAGRSPGRRCTSMRARCGSPDRAATSACASCSTGGSRPSARASSPTAPHRPAAPADRRRPRRGLTPGAYQPRQPGPRRTGSSSVSSGSRYLSGSAWS